MRPPPDLSDDRLIETLRITYGLSIAALHFLPIGYDPKAFVFRATATGGVDWFVKVRIGAFSEAGLRVPALLAESGVPHLLPPRPALSGALFGTVDDLSVAVYPYIHGENAMKRGLSEEQWRTFGRTLRAIHDGGFADRLRGQLPEETFSLPNAPSVRHLSEKGRTAMATGPAATAFARFWDDHAARIDELRTRAEALGRILRSRRWELVLCHADIHAANLLIDENENLYLIDWDAPLLAPRERDFLFVVGSQIARRVTPREESRFFDGYGETSIDRAALTYFRYERILEDIGEIAPRVLGDPNQDETARQAEADLLRGFFAPGGSVESAIAGDPGGWSGSGFV
ncbi:MAG: phosphotransferase [Capsulimonadales bacterium]|nr:phosphotransferase [Capsulimonadales bacterium]